MAQTCAIAQHYRNTIFLASFLLLGTIGIFKRKDQVVWRSHKSPIMTADRQAETGEVLRQRIQACWGCWAAKVTFLPIPSFNGVNGSTETHASASFTPCSFIKFR